jgi:hypothetical protein
VATERWADPIEGVSLAQYAAVVAAQAEGHGLDDALGWAGVAAGTWRKAAPAWRRALLDGAARAAYHREAAKAEDRLRRPVPPIEEDAAAWVAFMACVAEAPDVLALLAKIDLGPNDVSRLTRAWARRMTDDAALRRRIADLPRPSPAVMPAVRPGPRVPLTPAASSAAPAAVAVVAPALPSVPEAQAVPAVTPVVPTYLAQVEVRMAAEPAPLPAPDTGSGKTLDVGDVWRSGAALPFSEGAAEAVATGSARSAEEGPAEGHRSGATVDVSEAWRSGELLPFPGSMPARPVETTVDVGEAWRTGQALPFGPTQAAASPASAATRLSLEQYASLVVELAAAPARAAETLNRYGLSAADKEALDAAWRARLADARERAAFAQACATYRAWLERSTRQ